MARPSLDRVHLELTNRCNFRCEFCPQDSLTRPAGEMDVSLFRSLVSEIAREKIAPAVAYHVMGEPLLCPWLADALTWTREAGLRALLITNGSLLSPDRAKAIAAAQPHFVGISLQTPSPESFRLRGAGTTSFADFRDTLLSGVRTVLKNSPATRVSVYLLTTPLRWAFFPATRGLSILNTSRALQRTVRSWAGDLLNTLGPSNPDGLQPERERRIGKLRVWRQNRLDLTQRLSIETRIAGDWGRRAREGDAACGRYPARFGSCNGLAEQLAVLCDGTYAYCCTDHGGHTSTAKARDLSISQFLELPAVRRDREGFRRLRVHNPACRVCLGGPTRLHRAIRTGGSVFYHGIYRRWFQDPMRYRDP